MAPSLLRAYSSRESECRIFPALTWNKRSSNYPTHYPTHYPTNYLPSTMHRCGTRQAWPCTRFMHCTRLCPAPLVCSQCSAYACASNLPNISLSRRWWWLESALALLPSSQSLINRPNQSRGLNNLTLRSVNTSCCGGNV